MKNNDFHTIIMIMFGFGTFILALLTFIFTFVGR
ncbi:putative holin-like toxin [Cloacibacillus evryensis]|uniref:Holin-like toxin n=1 Tax=Cloacibacillus evryensis TaxID=508460 RepID=A0AAW5K6V5_9BACT|nr:putative holin-like toxin [Cloacibacillus evryensis]EHL63850.1 hypothetical protein HMPREF1006_01109 [Synergistes sp. 3_1_syn1]MCQ4765351.1 putative holin-like toxin [Cloacibacillus evryensis]MCQ4814027.1 putative holin-like toxin [Cloacibacillus evryensis]MEA5034899.1 putative holin-like toxin [Cloacibacillus evryensis]